MMEPSEHMHAYINDSEAQRRVYSCALGRLGRCSMVKVALPVRARLEGSRLKPWLCFPPSTGLR